jgi:hypothetical protein
MDSNHRPLPCQGSALDQLSYGPTWQSHSNGIIASRQTCPVAKRSRASDNLVVENSFQSAVPGSPFRPGTMVILTLGSPREKFWGAILGLSSEGVSICGIELASFEDLLSMVKEGEPFSPGVVFFPMHRVERMELDLPDGALPSLTQRFNTSTGLAAADLLRRHASNPHLAEAPK